MNTTSLKYRTKASASLYMSVEKEKKDKRFSAKFHAVRHISAGTRTRSLWIRSPARYSIAPQRLRQHRKGLVHFSIHISPHRLSRHPCNIRTNPGRLPLLTTRGCCFPSLSWRGVRKCKVCNFKAGNGRLTCYKLKVVQSESSQNVLIWNDIFRKHIILKIV